MSARASVFRDLMLAVFQDSPEKWESKIMDLKYDDKGIIYQRALMYIAIDIGKTEWVKKLLMMGVDPTVKECGSLSPLEMAKLMNKEDEEDIHRKFILDLTETVAVVKSKGFQNVTDLRLSTDKVEMIMEDVISLQPGISGASQCKAAIEVPTGGEETAKKQMEMPDVKPSENLSHKIESDEMGCSVEIGMYREKLEQVPECIEDTASVSESTEDSTFQSVHGDVDDSDKRNLNQSDEDERCHESSLLTSYESSSCHSLDNEECDLSEVGNNAGKKMHESKQMDVPLEESDQCTRKEPLVEHAEFTKEVEQFKKGYAPSEVVQDGIKKSLQTHQGLSTHKGEVFSPVEDQADKSSKGDIEICNVNDSDRSNGKEKHFPRCLMGTTSPSMHQKVDVVPSEHAPVPGEYMSNHVSSKEPVAKEDLFSSLDTVEKNIRLKETNKIDGTEIKPEILSSEKQNEKLVISIEESEPHKGHFKQSTSGTSQVVPDSKMLQEGVSSNQELNVLQEKDLSTEKNCAYRSNENLNTDKGKDAVEEAGCASDSGKTCGKEEHVPSSMIDTIFLSSAEASHEYSIPTQEPDIVRHLAMKSQVPLAQGNAGTNVGFQLKDKTIRDRVPLIVENFERQHGGTKMIRETKDDGKTQVTKDDGKTQVASGIISPGKAKIEEDASTVPSKHVNAAQRSAIRKIGEDGKQMGVPTGVQSCPTAKNRKGSSKSSIDSPSKGPSVKKRSAEEAYTTSEENCHYFPDCTRCDEKKPVPHNVADDVINSIRTMEFLHSDKKPKIHTQLSDEVIGGNGSSALISKDVDGSEFPSLDVAIQELGGCMRMPRTNESLKQLARQNQQHEVNLNTLQGYGNIVQSDEDKIILGKPTVEDLIEGVNKLGFIDTNKELPKKEGEGSVSCRENKKLDIPDKGEMSRFREAGVTEFMSTSSSPLKDNLFADNGLLFDESSIASSEREKSEDRNIPDECVSGKEKLNGKKAISTETPCWMKTLSRFGLLSKVMRHGSEESCASKKLHGNASESNAGDGNPCEMHELKKESDSSAVTKMTTVSLNSKVLDCSLQVPTPELSSSGKNVGIVGSQTMYCSQTSRDENIHLISAGDRPYQEMRDLQGKASYVAQSLVGTHQATDVGHQPCVQEMLAMTEIYSSSENKVYLVRKLYEKLYSNFLLGSIVMKFVARRDLMLKIDCESETIHRMISKFRDHDGEFVNGRERSTHVDFKERVIYFAIDLTSKNVKELVCLGKLGSSLCLMSVYLAFSNDGRPYEAGNRVKMAEFRALIEDAMAKKRRREQLMRVIKKALDKRTLLGKEIAMILALSEIISHDGLKCVLGQQLPSLLHFFENHVILTIEKKIEGKA